MNQPYSHWELAVRHCIWPTLIAWGQGHRPADAQIQHLIAWELAHSQQPWQMTPATVAATLESKAALLQAVVSDMNPHLPALSSNQLSSNQLSSNQLSSNQTDEKIGQAAWTDWIEPIWRLWLPLAQQLDRQQKALGAPFIQGILGGQGTGKTTLTRMLQIILKHLGHPSVGLSIDDLYLSHAARQALQQQDPRLIWRGPPGTHDIELGIRTLEQFKQTGTQAETQVSVPQFDKSLFQGLGDRTEPLIQPAPSIILFEGWFVGAQPLADSAFDTEFDPEFDPESAASLPDPILTAADRQFAKDCNDRLRPYQSLWRFLDSLIVLYPQDYRLSQQWRLQAEHDMKAQGKPGLSDSEIIDFVTYFWKALHPDLFITPLTQSPTTALVVEITAAHRVGELYAPAFGHDDLYEVLTPVKRSPTHP
jgi:D-glycerate 3-kinase